MTLSREVMPMLSVFSFYVTCFRYMKKITSMTIKGTSPPTFEVNDNEIIKISRIVCASLNHPHGANIKINCANHACPENKDSTLREARESTRRIVDMVLTDGLSPPADCRHFIEETAEKDGPLTSLFLSLKNTSLEQFPFLLRQSLYEGKVYTLVTHSSEYKDPTVIQSADKKFSVIESNTCAVDYDNSSIWLNHLRRFAYPVCRSLLANTKLFLLNDGLHENMSAFSVCVIAIGKESLCDAERVITSDSKNLTVFRWYLALRSRESSVLIAIGYMRTIFSSPEDLLIPEHLVRTKLADSDSYTIDQSSLKNIAANRFTRLEVISNSKLYTIAVQCGFVERFENGYRGSYKRSFEEAENNITETSVYRLLEPQLCFSYTPRSKPTSIEKISKLWKKSSLEVPETNVRMRKFIEKLKSPLFTEFSQRGKRVARLLHGISEKNIAKERIGLEETMNLELKSFGWDSTKGPDAKNTSKFTTDKVCKYVTSFLNAHGGALLFGVSDSGHCLGVTEDFDTLKKACLVGFKGIRPVVPEHMSFIKKQPLKSTDVDSETYLLEFAACEGSAPFYSAGAPLQAPSWGRFLASTAPLHSSVLLERLVLYAPKFFKETK